MPRDEGQLPSQVPGRQKPARRGFHRSGVTTGPADPTCCPITAGPMVIGPIVVAIWPMVGPTKLRAPGAPQTEIRGVPGEPPISPVTVVAHGLTPTPAAAGTPAPSPAVGSTWACASGA